MSTNRVVDVSTGLWRPPFMLVLLAFVAVNEGSSGLDITHAFILVVTHPIDAVPPEAIIPGIDDMIIVGLMIFTAHCAPAALPVVLLEQERV